MYIPEDILTLIIAGRQRKLTRKEELALQSWLQLNPCHQAEVQKLLSSLQEYQSAECFRQIDTDIAWNRVNRQISSSARWSQTRHIRRWGKIAAVLVPLVLAGSWFRGIHSGEERKTNLPETVVTQANLPQVELTLADGQKIILKNQKQKKIKDQAGKVIGTDSADILVYSPGTVEKQEWNTVKIPGGGEYQLLLSDGTRIWLNSATELEFPVQFNGRERRVKLKGEAYFKVVKDSLRPFLVETEYSEIRVLGTSFNVSAYREDGYQHTTLVEGSVEVLLPEDTYRLGPGEQWMLNVREHSVAVKKVDVLLYTSWKDGIFRFSDMPLDELTVKLQRWYNIRFLFQNADCRRARFTGAVPRDVKIDDFIRLIETTTSVKFEMNGDTVIILKK